MNIRRASQSDIEEIVACVNSSYFHYIERIGKKPAPMLVNYQQAIDEHTVYVVTDESVVVGVLVLIESNNQFFIENIAIHKNSQGKGFGKSLLNLAESIATTKGHEFIELYTHESMVENISLYKYFGYCISHQRTEHGYNRVYMKKRLIS